MSDTEQQAAEFAQLLGLYKGAAYQPVVPVQARCIDRINAIRQASNKDDNGRPLMRRLAADYFPSLMRTVTEQLEEANLPLNMEMLDWGLGWLAQAILHAHPFAIRFVREHSDEARRFFAALANRLGEVGRLPIWDYSYADALPRLMVVTLEYLFFYLIFNATSDSPYLWPFDPPTRAGIAIVLNRSDAQNGLKNAVPLRRFAEISKGLDIWKTRADWIKLPENGWKQWSYWACEAKIRAGEDPTKTGSCVKGAELAGCSRCLSVRYCSQAHQKADWKQHKPLCIKPSW